MREVLKMKTRWCRDLPGETDNPPAALAASVFVHEWKVLPSDSSNRALVVKGCPSSFTRSVLFDFRPVLQNFYSCSVRSSFSESFLHLRLLTLGTDLSR